MKTEKTQDLSFLAYVLWTFKEKMGFEFWQKFAKTLIVVIAVMPAAGILISVGRLMDNGFLAGIGAELPTGHVVLTIGGIIQNIGWFIIVNLGFLFAVAISGSWADNKAGGAFNGAILYLVFHTVLWPIAFGMWSATPALDMNLLEDSTMGIKTLKGSQVFSGILLGFVAGNTYNKYSGFDKLPSWLSFFGGSRFVPFVVLYKSIIFAFLFALVWPWLNTGIEQIGKWLAGGDNIFYAPFIYGMGERLMLPFGLHHMITIPINYTNVGGTYWSLQSLSDISQVTPPIFGQDPLWLAWMGDISWMENTLEIPNASNLSGPALYAMAQESGNESLLTALNELGDKMGDMDAAEAANYWAGIVPARFKTGQVVISTIILPAGAIAMYKTLPKANRTTAFSIYISSAVAVAIAGITEPIEFMFAFIAPLMYLGYSVISGLAFAMVDVMTLLGAPIRLHAFGIIEVIARSPQMLVTSLWKDFLNFWIYSLGFGALAYVYFYFATKYLNPAIPGTIQSEGGDTAAIAKNEFKLKTSNVPHEDRIINIVKAFGGPQNITSVDNCMTRLRIEIKEPNLFNKKLMMNQKAIGLFIKGKAIQVIFGAEADVIRNKVDKLLANKKVLKTLIWDTPTQKPAIKTRVKQTQNLEKLTIVELKGILLKSKIKYASTARKKDLIKIIKKELKK